MMLGFCCAHQKDCSCSQDWHRRSALVNQFIKNGNDRIVLFYICFIIKQGIDEKYEKSSISFVKH